MNGFVIGNGESRAGFDLEQLRPFGHIYGCNALYRDFIPDTLISVDEQMIKILERDKVSDKCEVIRRKVDRSNNKLFISSLGTVIEDRYHGASGPSAVYIMCDRVVSLKNVYLIGFDLHSNLGTINNVYKSTEGYRRADSPPTYAGNWANKLARIFADYPHVTFYKVCADCMNMNFVSEWNNAPNLVYSSFDVMLSVLKGD